MKILFHLGHPAHFHLFKNVIKKLEINNHSILILIKEKDVLRKLLDHSEYDYLNILTEGKSPGKIGLIKDLYKRGNKIFSVCKDNEPDLLIGTSVDISYVGRLLNIPAINVNEDDANVVPLYAWMAYPLATSIVSPDCCNNGRWQKKTHTYSGYHELAYLHPENFSPSKEIVAKYIKPEMPFIILRFASLSAHHDDGVRGIDDNIAIELVDKLKPFGAIIITSERMLSAELERYRKSIDPVDIHHLLAYARLVIGDSQTMSAEAAVLGTPFIRYNDFVDKIGYLKELEKNYKLGYGIKPKNKELLISKAIELLKNKNTMQVFQERKDKMLTEKINVAEFIYDYIISYPDSNNQL